ncbi:MAG: helix-turn-helix transcriptional regulator, partial [Betaproteobacteria bacterium]|nr:helix-turn-helix transcriptional regulator [Betaproteobacteria bacterium]
RTTVSHHLKVLREAGVLRSEKIGKEVWFWLDKDHLIDALGAVRDYLKEKA